MDPLLQMMVRIAYWLRHPPAKWQMWTMTFVAISAAALVAAEFTGLWPNWFSVEKTRLFP